MKKLATILCLLVAMSMYYTASACVDVKQLGTTQTHGGPCIIDFEISDKPGGPIGIGCVQITVYGTPPYPGGHVPSEISDYAIVEGQLPDTVEFILNNFPCSEITGFTYEAWTSNICGEGTSCDAHTPLPVQLASWTGEAMGRTNKLEWATASELNTMAFVIERSGNGRTNWQELGRVEAIGFSTESQHYSFADEAPMVTAYYRLRSVDFDGYYEFSDLIIVERDRKLLEDVLIFPNPVQDDWAQVSFKSDTDRKAMILLSDVAGNILLSINKDVHKGINTLDLDFGALPEGVYFLRMELAEGVLGKKIVRTSKD